MAAFQGWASGPNFSGAAQNMAQAVQVEEQRKARQAKQLQDLFKGIGDRRRRKEDQEIASNTAEAAAKTATKDRAIKVVDILGRRVTALQNNKPTINEYNNNQKDFQTALANHKSQVSLIQGQLNNYIGNNPELAAMLGGTSQQSSVRTGGPTGSTGVVNPPQVESQSNNQTAAGNEVDNLFSGDQQGDGQGGYEIDDNDLLSYPANLTGEENFTLQQQLGVDVPQPGASGERATFGEKFWGMYRDISEVGSQGTNSLDRTAEYWGYRASNTFGQQYNPNQDPEKAVEQEALVREAETDKANPGRVPSERGASGQWDNPESMQRFYEKNPILSKIVKRFATFGDPLIDSEVEQNILKFNEVAAYSAAGALTGVAGGMAFVLGVPGASASAIPATKRALATKIKKWYKKQVLEYAKKQHSGQATSKIGKKFSPRGGEKKVLRQGKYVSEPTVPQGRPLTTFGSLSKLFK